MKILIAAMLIMTMQMTFGQEDNLSTDEKVVLLTILGEARGEGEDGMHAVACVIQQRAIERHLTPAKVCRQRMQFSCWNNASIEALEKKVTKTSQGVIDYASALSKDIVAGKNLDRSVVGFANHYCVTSLNPSWSRGVEPVAVFKHHKFFRL